VVSCAGQYFKYFIGICHYVLQHMTFERVKTLDCGLICSGKKIELNFGKIHEDIIGFFLPTILHPSSPNESLSSELDMLAPLSSAPVGLGEL
jgi:hypothetical protein